jgi:hypothetical protein
MKKGNALTVTKASVPHAMWTRCGQSADDCGQLLCKCAATDLPRGECNAMERHATPSHTMSRQCQREAVTEQRSDLGLGGTA